MSFILHLESLIFSSLLNKDVSGWLLERGSHPICFFFFFFFFGISQLHSAIGGVDHPQCYDELFGDPI